MPSHPTTEKSRHYRPERIPAEVDVIVVGSGIAGLSAASALAQRGRRVLVLERHRVAGGMTHAFRRKRFEWDVGLHYVGRVGVAGDPLARAFRHVPQGRVDWAALDEHYDEVEFPGFSFAFPRGAKALRAALTQQFPDQARGIARYFFELRKVAVAMQLRVLGEVADLILGRWAQRALEWPLRKMASLTTSELLDNVTHDRRLRAILTGQWGNYGNTPELACFAAHALVTNHFLEGGFYPAGGSRKLAEAMTLIIRSQGGDVLTCAEVDEICIAPEAQGGRCRGVRMADGTKIVAKQVVAATGTWMTHERLLRHWHKSRGHAPLSRRKPCTAHYALFLGLRGSPDKLGLPAKNIWLHPTPDHDANRRRYEHDRNADFPVVFLSSGAAKDPQFRRERPGLSTLEAIVPAHFDDVERWQASRWRHRGPEYEQHKADLAARIEAIVLRRFPALAGAIEWRELSTPLTTNHFCATQRGELYGFGADARRFTHPLRDAMPSIPGLQICGQDTVFLGVCGAMLSGVLAAARVAGLGILIDAFAPKSKRNV